MKNQGKWARRLQEMWQTEAENLSLLPVLELCGDRRLLIENHGGVVQYGPEKICVRVRFGILVVIGSALRLCQMQHQQLVIMGQIDAIHVNRGRK